MRRGTLIFQVSVQHMPTNHGSPAPASIICAVQAQMPLMRELSIHNFPPPTHRDQPLGLCQTRKPCDSGNQRTLQLCQPLELPARRIPRLHSLARSTASLPSSSSSSAKLPEEAARHSRRLPWPCEWYTYEISCKKCLSLFAAWRVS